MQQKIGNTVVGLSGCQYILNRQSSIPLNPQLKRRSPFLSRQSDSSLRHMTTGNKESHITAPLRMTGNYNSKGSRAGRCKNLLIPQITIPPGPASQARQNPVILSGEESDNAFCLRFIFRRAGTGDKKYIQKVSIVVIHIHSMS
jgi:hypothetical protein